jgi:hypothetical protein
MQTAYSLRVRPNHKENRTFAHHQFIMLLNFMRNGDSFLPSQSNWVALPHSANKENADIIALTLGLKADQYAELIEVNRNWKNFMFVSYDASNPRNTRPRRKAHKLNKFDGRQRAKKNLKLPAQAGLRQIPKPPQSKAKGIEVKVDTNEKIKPSRNNTTPYKQPKNISPVSIMREATQTPSMRLQSR